MKKLVGEWLEGLLVFNSMLKEITVTREMWFLIQDKVYSDPKFHLFAVQHIHGEPDYIYVFGIKIVKGDT